MSCTPVKLPKVTADFCAPDINFGEVSRIMLANLGNPMANVEDLAEWTARLDNDDVADETKIKHLYVIGDKPAPESSELALSAGRKVYTDKKHTVNIKVDETGDDNYALIKWLEENVGQTILIWYVAGKYIYGGNSGIEATLTLDDVIPESDEELNTFVGAAKYEGGHPDRHLNPMA